MKVLVVDDEILARKRAVDLLERLQNVHTVLEAATGREAIALLLNQTFDLVLLDIQMTDMTGFEVLLQIPNVNRPSIIFITAYDEFAINAFEVKAIDYLQKPYKDERFYEAISRVEQFNQDKVENLIGYLKSNLATLSNEKQTIENVVIKKGSSYYFVPTEEIKYIISSAYYAEIFTTDNKKHIYRISMSDFIEILGSNFIRVNRSAIIHKGFINSVVSEGMGDYSIIMNDRKSFSLSKNYKEAFLDELKIRNIKNG